MPRDCVALWLLFLVFANNWSFTNTRLDIITGTIKLIQYLPSLTPRAWPGVLVCCSVVWWWVLWSTCLQDKSQTGWCHLLLLTSSRSPSATSGHLTSHHSRPHSQLHSSLGHWNRFYGAISSLQSSTNRWGGGRGGEGNCDLVIIDDHNYVYLSFIFRPL